MTDLDLDDDDDWVDLQKPIKQGKSASLPEASVRISISQFKARKSTTPRAFMALRGSMATWINDHGPRFKVQIGGAFAEKIRIVADGMGRFEAVMSMKGRTMRLFLGAVAAWPSEEREPTEAKVAIDGNFVVLTLPVDFSRPRSPPAGAPPNVRPAPVAQPRKEPERGAPLSFGGDPGPGRSALDQIAARQRAGK